MNNIYNQIKIDGILSYHIEQGYSPAAVVISNIPDCKDTYSNMYILDDEQYLKIYDLDKIVWQGKLKFKKDQNGELTLSIENINEDLWFFYVGMNFRVELFL